MILDQRLPALDTRPSAEHGNEQLTMAQGWLGRLSQVGAAVTQARGQGSSGTQAKATVGALQGLLAEMRVVQEYWLYLLDERHWDEVEGKFVMQMLVPPENGVYPIRITKPPRNTAKQLLSS